MTSIEQSSVAQFTEPFLVALGRYGHGTSQMGRGDVSPILIARQLGIPESHITGALQVTGYPVVTMSQEYPQAPHISLRVSEQDGSPIYSSFDPFEPGVFEAAGGPVAFIAAAPAELPPGETVPSRAPVQLDRRINVTTITEALYALGYGGIQDFELYQPNYHEALLRLNRITPKELAEAYAMCAKAELIDLVQRPPDPRVRNLIGTKVITQQWLLPHHLNEQGELVIVVSDPTDSFLKAAAEDDLKGRYPVRLAVAVQHDIEAFITRTYIRVEQEAQLAQEAATRTGNSGAQVARLPGDDVVSARIMSALTEAAGNDASDVHFQSVPDGLRIRERLHGNLISRGIIPEGLRAQTLNQLKILSGMSTESVLPQDRRANVEVPVRGQLTQLRLRFSSIPALNGDSIVVRLLRDVTSLPKLDESEFSPHNLELVRDATRASNGMILVTGPTGSGKTTLMHVVLQQLNDPTVKIMTIEDPIEYEQPDMVQSAVRLTDDAETSLPFARILRAQMRQDPDIIFVGEIRDEETASVAVNAAQTGHLLLSTLHTNNAVSTVTRLLDLGVPPYLIAESLRLIISQRLVGRPCPECSITEPIPAPYNHSGKDTMRRGTGIKDGVTCPRCNGTGDYRIIPIHEVLPVTKDVRDAIVAKDMAALNVAAQMAGMKTLLQDGLDKVRGHAANLSRVLDATK